MLLRGLRFVAGAAAGFLIWWYGTPYYDAVLAVPAQAIVRVDGRLCGAELRAADRAITVRPRLCPAPPATIPADQLTYNVILLAGLFAMRWRNLSAFLASLAIVAATQVLSLAVSIESTYAARQDAWSVTHYSNFARDVWVSAEFWWRLVGMFAVVFVCWWMATAIRSAVRRK